MTAEQKLKHLLCLQQYISQTHSDYQQLQALTHQAFLKTLGAYSYSAISATPSLGEPQPTINDQPIRSVLTAVYTPPAGEALPGFNDAKCISIINDTLGIAEELALLLRAFPVLVHHCQQTIAPGTDVLIDLCGLQAINSINEAIALNEIAFTSSQTFLRQLGNPLPQAGEGSDWNGSQSRQLTKNRQACYISVQDTDGDFGLSGECGKRAWLAGMSGLSKTIAAEHPNLHVKAIDIATNILSKQEIAKKIFQELQFGSAHLEVGYRANGERITLALLPTPLALAPLSLKNGAIIVSGGGRGITADCMIALAAQCHAHFVLLGRSQILPEDPDYANAHSTQELQGLLIQQAKNIGQLLTPKHIQQQVNAILAGRYITATLRRIRAQGASAEYIAVDIQDQAAMNAELAAIRQHHKIIGIIHGAGVLADKLITDKTLEQYRLVFNTKIQGLHNLLTATAQDQLELIYLFSSVAARFGNRGQSDYAMANEILNKVAQHLSHHYKSCQVKAINWGPWESGMVTAELKQNFAKQGISLLTAAQGTQMFIAELSDQSAAAEVIIGSGLNPKNKIASCKPYQYAISINAQEFAYLHDHQINGVVVIPACQVLEWFIQAAQAIDVDLPYYACSDLKVLRGISLTNFDTAAQQFTIQVSPQLQGERLVLGMLLVDSAQQTRYSAKLIKTPGLETSAINNITPLNNATTWPWTTSQIYQQPRLFHGAAFQVIAELNTISANGGTARLHTKPLTHTCTPFITLDGCLQLFRLWSLHYQQQLSLPASIADYQVYDFNWPSTVTCVFNSQIMDAHHSIHSALLQTATGKTLAAITQVTMFNLPNS